MKIKTHSAIENVKKEFDLKKIRKHTYIFKICLVLCHPLTHKFQKHLGHMHTILYIDENIEKIQTLNRI